uniref:CD200 receptor 1 n=1 Tax=Mus musculus TaxID=10090 RepID=A0A338P6B8_MOUSE
MFCFWRTSALAVLLIWGVFVAGFSCVALTVLELTLEIELA